MAERTTDLNMPICTRLCACVPVHLCIWNAHYLDIATCQPISPVTAHCIFPLHWLNRYKCPVYTSKFIRVGIQINLLYCGGRKQDGDETGVNGATDDAVEAHSCVDIVAKCTDEQYTTMATN